MKESKLSVIVPVYKVEQYLSRCVESILEQTFSDFELILVDDGSPDKCPVMCDEWAIRDGRVKVIHQENQGLAGAVKRGVEFACGEYITFVDSDDWVEPTFLQVLYDGIVENCADVAQCNLQRVDGSNICEYIFPPCILDGVDEIKKGYLLPMADPLPKTDELPVSVNRCTKIYKSEILKAAMPLYDTSVVIGEDVYLNYAVFGLCTKIVVLDTPPLYNYWLNPNSMMSSFNPKQKLNLDAFCDGLDRLAERYGCPSGNAPYRKNKLYMGYIHERAASCQTRVVRKKEIQTIIRALDRKIWFELIKTLETPQDKIGMYLYYYGLIDVALALTELAKQLRQKKEKICAGK